MIGALVGLLFLLLSLAGTIGYAAAKTHGAVFAIAAIGWLAALIWCVLIIGSAL